MGLETIFGSHYKYSYRVPTRHEYQTRDSQPRKSTAPTVPSNSSSYRKIGCLHNIGITLVFLEMSDRGVVYFTDVLIKFRRNTYSFRLQADTTVTSTENFSKRKTKYILPRNRTQDPMFSNCARPMGQLYSNFTRS